MSKHNRLYVLFIVYLLCPILFVFSQESNPPDPNSLSSGWWQYYDVQGDFLDNRIKNTQIQLESILESVSENNREKARALVEKMIANLLAIQQLEEQRSILPPPRTPIANRYSLNSVMQLNHDLQKNALTLKSLQDEEKTLDRQINATSNYLISLKNSYLKAEDRSQEKLLLGLELLTVQSSKELTKKRIQNLDERINFAKQSDAHIKEEFEKAIQRIVVSSNEIENLEHQIQKEKVELEKLIKNQKLVEIESALTLPSADPYDSTKDQYFTQLELKSVIETGFSNVKLTSLKIQLGISKLVLNPTSLNISVLQSLVTKWSNELYSYQEKIEQWTSMTLQQTQRTGLFLSVEEQASSKITQVQKQIIQLTTENRLALQRLGSEINEALSLLDLLESKVNEKLTGKEKWFRKGVLFLNRSINGFLSWINKGLFHVGQTPITLLNILRFFIVVIVTVWLSKLTIRGLDQALLQRQKRVRRSVAYRINRLVHYSILTFGFLIAFSTLGFDFTNLVLIAGALGVGLGFGLQSIFNNFVSGIIILFESYLRVGDFVEVDPGVRGEIKAINFRSLIIRTNDGIDVLIPNSDVINNKIVNWTLNDPYRRIHIPFNVAYGSDKDLVKRVVEEAAKDVELTLKHLNIPPPKVRFIKFDKSCLEFELAVWVDERATRRTRKTRSAYLWVIDDVLRKNGVVIPFPQRDVHIKEG